MRRYREAAALALATVAVQVGVTALLDVVLALAGVYPSFVKWAAMGLLGSVAGWRGSRPGLLAIVATNVAWYAAVGVLSGPDTALADVVRVTVVFVAIAGAGYLVGSWVRHGRPTTGSVSRAHPAG
jgi:hypothetical protein